MIVEVWLDEVMSHSVDDADEVMLHCGSLHMSKYKMLILDTHEGEKFHYGSEDERSVGLMSLGVTDRPLADVCHAYRQ